MQTRHSSLVFMTLNVKEFWKNEIWWFNIGHIALSDYWDNNHARNIFNKRVWMNDENKSNTSKKVNSYELFLIWVAF